MRGTVKSFLPEKAYGFIRGEDGRDYFFHLNDLVNRFEPVPLQTVYFDPTATRKGLKARSIQAGPMPTVTPVGPNHFIMTRDNYVLNPRPPYSIGSPEEFTQATAKLRAPGVFPAEAMPIWP